MTPARASDPVVSVELFQSDAERLRFALEGRWTFDDLTSACRDRLITALRIAEPTRRRRR
jgi:hypothetical protein